MSLFKQNSDCQCFKGDLCAPNPCANGGTCLSDGSSIRCSCKPGFQGDLCQICDACNPNPVIFSHNFFLLQTAWTNSIFLKCFNKGVCVSNGLGSFACKCAPGTTGRTCDYCKIKIISFLISLLNFILYKIQ